jgi:hypothetical protein
MTHGLTVSLDRLEQLLPARSRTGNAKMLSDSDPMKLFLRLTLYNWASRHGSCKPADRRFVGVAVLPYP